MRPEVTGPPTAGTFPGGAAHGLRPWVQTRPVPKLPPRRDFGAEFERVAGTDRTPDRNFGRRIRKRLLKPPLKGAFSRR